MDLPSILTGPILRRVEGNCIIIWVATSYPFQIDAKLFKMTEELPEFDIQCKAESIRFGKRLFIHLLKLTPVHGEFPVDTLLGYNLFLKRKSKTLDLGDLGLLNQQESQSIVYGNLKYPSFFINRDLESHVLYGSCRKLHGERDDALAVGDMELQSTYGDLNKRPSSLFLLGDQIYADDVADPLFPIITSLSKRLMGRDEKLSTLDKRLEEVPFRNSLDQINGREYIMDHFCKFTSAQSQNHLMKFGEYAAMYLLSWGPVLWDTIQKQGSLSTFDEVIENNQLHFVFPRTNQYKKEHKIEYSKLQRRFNRQSENIRQMIPTIHRVKRLLANIPTYMIFDDHDVTDDWNLSKDWQENVFNSPLGRHVEANGLGAYWAFQGWGNSPESFDHLFISRMKKYFTEFNFESSTYHSWLNGLRDFTSWHFVAPTEPKTIFLDTRTQRTFDDTPQPVKIGMDIHENVRSPQLISHDGWQLVSETLLNSGWRSGDCLTIVSPVPLYGVGPIESILTSYVYPLRALGIPVHQAIDYEAWKYNGKGFSEFLDWVFKWNPSTCLIVSGDAHYASSVKSSIESIEGSRAIIQFTSSPMHNMSFTGIWGMLLKFTIWMSSLKRKNKNIVRYCDNAYNLRVKSSDTPCPSDCLWSEMITYLSTDKGTLVQTDNNLGLYSISQEKIQNKLLHIKNFNREKDLVFEPIQLNSF